MKNKFVYEINATWFECGRYEVRTVGQFVGLGDAEICRNALQAKADETESNVEYSIHSIK